MPSTLVQSYWQSLKKGLDQKLDLEEKIDHLRIFTRKSIQEIESRDLQGILPLLNIFEELTSLAEAVLRGGVEISLEQMMRSVTFTPGPFAIVAMGKFGGCELTYRSDLDLIYLYERQDDQEFYTRLGQRIISSLTLLTREGTAYQIDTSLRPSGNGGTLVSSLKAFEEYHREMGRTWERQALIKGRPVYGNPQFCRKIADAIETISYKNNDQDKISKDIDTLRKKMERDLAREKEGTYNIKTGRGGLVDIEFIVQYLQLLHGGSERGLRSPHTIQALNLERESGLLEPDEADRLKEAYLFYRTIETRLRMILDQPTDEIRAGADWLKEMQNRFFGGKPIIPICLETRERVRAIYEKIFTRK